MQKRNEPRQAIRYVSQAEIAVIDGFALMLTDGHTDGHTDRPSCRDARTHLTKPDTRHKMHLVCVLFTFENNTGRTYGRTYGPTDGRTDTTSYRDATAHLKTR